MYTAIIHYKHAYHVQKDFTKIDDFRCFIKNHKEEIIWARLFEEKSGEEADHYLAERSSETELLSV